MKITVELNGNHINTQDCSTDTSITVGRADDNIIVLESSSVSRNHCVINYIDGLWILDDLQSTNGVQLDGKRISSEAVKNKSIIAIRPFQLLISLPEEEQGELITSDADDSDSTIIEDRTVVDLDHSEDEEEPTLVGGGLGGGSVSHSENKKQDFILVQSGLSAGTSLPLFKKNIIGRKNSCDLVLSDDGIEAEHVEIVLGAASYRFSNLMPRNAIQLNGKTVSSGSLKNGDVLKLGQVELGVRLETKSGLRGSSPVVNKRVALLSILLVVMVCGTIGVFSMGGSEKEEPGNSGAIPPNPKIENTVPGTVLSGEEIESGKSEKTRKDDELIVKKEEMTLAQKRDFDLFMNEARQYMDLKDYRTAATRCKSALGVDPGNSSARKLLEECHAKLQEKEDLVAQQEKLSDEYRKTALLKIVEIGELITAGDLMSALEEVSELEKQNEAFPQLAEIQKQTQRVRMRLSKEQSKYQNKIKKTKLSFEKQLEALRLAYDAGERAYNDGKYDQARELWLKVANTHLNIPEKKQAAINISKLDKEVSKEAELSYKKAKQAIGKKDFPTAVVYLSQVLAMDAAHGEAKKDYDRLYPMQMKKAEHAYREGLVFEGISRIDQAIKQWRKVTTILPLVDDKYYILARKRLEEHGVR